MAFCLGEPEEAYGKSVIQCGLCRMEPAERLGGDVTPAAGARTHTQPRGSRARRPVPPRWAQWRGAGGAGGGEAAETRASLRGRAAAPSGVRGVGGGEGRGRPSSSAGKWLSGGDQVGAQPQSGAATGAVDMAEGTRSLTRARSRVFRTWQSEEPGSQRCRLALGTDGCRTAALSQLRQKVPRALGGAAARPAWSQGPTRQQVGPLRPPCGPRPAFPPTEGRFPHGRRGHSRPLGLMLARGQEPSLALGSRVKPPATKSACS